MHEFTINSGMLSPHEFMDKQLRRSFTDVRAEQAMLTGAGMEPAAALHWFNLLFRAGGRKHFSFSLRGGEVIFRGAGPG